MAVLRVGTLPETAGAAAARFYTEVLPRIGSELSEMVNKSPHHSPEGEGLVTLIFPQADHSHRAWRRAAIQSLAREYAPSRINALASDSEAALTAAIAYLEGAEGITGQLLELDGTGAGLVVSPAA